MNNHKFAIHDANKPKRAEQVVVNAQPVHVVKVPSVSSIPNGTNILYNIDGSLYYRTGDTITLLATK